MSTGAHNVDNHGAPAPVPAAHAPAAPAPPPLHAPPPAPPPLAAQPSTSSSLVSNLSATASAQLLLPKDPCGSITLLCAPTGELKVDKELLCAHSKFFSDMLTTCDAPQIKVDESLSDMSLFMEVAKGKPPASTFDTRSSACWELYKRIIDVADKYDCPLVRERSERWLVSRCLKGRVRCTDFKFQDVGLGMEWLVVCQKYGLRDLGWYVAYDLGLQLAEGAWPPASDFLREVGDPEFLKVMLEAVADHVQRTREGEGGSNTEYEEAEE